MTDQDALVAVATELARLATVTQELEEPAQVNVHPTMYPIVSVVEAPHELIDLHQEDGMLVVRIHYDGPEPGDVHEMQFDFSSAVHAPTATAQTIADAVFGA